MNVWRWLGLSLFLLGAVCLFGTTKFPSLAVGQEKKGTPTATGTPSPTPEVKKGTPTATPTVEKAKTETPKKPDEVKPEVKPAGDALVFKAFEPGKKIYQVQKTVTNQKMTVMNQPIDQKQEQTFVIEWATADKKDKENYVVTQKITGIEMEINIGGNKISYSSRKEEPKNPMTEFFKQLQKTPLTYKISPDLEVKEVENTKEFIKNLGDINPQMQSLLNHILSEDALKKMAEPTWWAFPAKGNLAEKKWTKKSELSLGPIGKYTTNFTFTFDSEKDGKVKINIETNLEYSAPADNKGLPFVITKAELKSESGKGHAIFDRKTGRFDHSEITMKLNGKLWIDVSNMSTEVTLNQEQTATSDTYDTDPWEKKK